MGIDTKHFVFSLSQQDTTKLRAQIKNGCGPRYGRGLVDGGGHENEGGLDDACKDC